MAGPSGSITTNFYSPPDPFSMIIPTIRSLSLEDLRRTAAEIIPQDRRPSQHLWDISDNVQQLYVLRACLLVFILSLGRVVPRDFQLEATLSALGNKDVIVSSGTGSGKTLIMTMLMLLCPMDLSLVIVPLKRLQNAQLEAFMRYGIPSVVINEDTPNDSELWKVNDRSLHLI